MSYDQLELFLFGAAVVLDSALRMMVFERINRPFVALWLKVLVAGTVAFHLGIFGRVMIAKIDQPEAMLFDHFFMCILVTGLFLLPSGMLHASVRISHTHFEAKPFLDRRYGLLYLPLLVIPFACGSILQSNHRNLIDSIAGIIPIYIGWLFTANIAAMFFFIWFRQTSDWSIPFLIRLVGSLCAISVGAASYGVFANNPFWEKTLRLPVCLSPLVPEGLFVWYALRHRVLPLVMDRSLVYASTLILILLFHQLAIDPIIATVKERTKVDLHLVEAIIFIGMFVLIPPLRMRSREALRYLFSTNVFHVRDATRLLSLSLSQQANLEPDALVQWFANELADKLDLDKAVIMIEHPTGLHSKDIAIVSQKSVIVATSASQEVDNSHAYWPILKAVQIRDRLERDVVLPRVDNSEAIDEIVVNAAQAMVRQGFLLAFRLSFQSVHGAVLLGDRRRKDRLADEQLISISLLCDQLAATLANKKESILRFQVERRMMQNEKLSTLGLIASSLAHELRNPLSSIRTIASLTKEELGPDHSNRQDLEIIVAEIDKLSQTTSRLLESARPADSNNDSVAPDGVISKLLVLLTPLARQLHVDVRPILNCPEVEVRTTEVAMSEVFFNLIKNGIEAATGRPDAWILIESMMLNESTVCVAVSDNGPGIDKALQNTLFDPFVTGKAHGTGLGLFVVADRIREMNGSIECCSPANNSIPKMTQFRVIMPVVGR